MSESNLPLSYNFTFQKLDIVKNWRAIQAYARKSSIEIEWDDSRDVLIARGESIDPRQMIDDISAMLHVTNIGLNDVFWSEDLQNWLCNVQLGTQIYRVLIVGDREASKPAIQRLSLDAKEHLKKKFSVWTSLVCDQIYPCYVERFSEGSPHGRDVFLDSLRVPDCITYNAKSNKYELYFAVDPLIKTHLINFVERNDVQYFIDIERI